jgi:monoamine oxidase
MDKDSILVIGAGASGLAAARELRRRGFSVTVVEARDRIGGRVFTHRAFDAPIELGASWIHGIYSHLPPGATDDDHTELGEPEGSRLFFAGEATHAEHPATVHGAILSGLREARRIAERFRGRGGR